MIITYKNNGKIIRIKVKEWEVKAYIKDIGQKNIINIARI